MKPDLDDTRPPRRLIRTAWALLFALIVPLLAMPSAQAAKPIRQRWFSGGDSFVFKAGDGCPFAIGVQVRYAFGSVTQYSDGRLVSTDHADFTITNLDTGASYVEHTNATFTDIFTPDGNIFDVLDGRFFAGFLPGDQGPDGQVGKGGASYILVGHFEATFDLNTGMITSFEGDGQAIDLCQLLGP